MASPARSPKGTSPRVRGKRALLLIAIYVLGYIPARAGEARPAPDRDRYPRVHPRACGGSADAVAGPGGREGTSPRVRGKPACCAVQPRPWGYIPARAGEAGAARAGASGAGVHPRACGGSSISFRLATSAAGTSPRVRGKLDHTLFLVLIHRYIPARAGEASRQCLCARRAEVHPRACGGSRALRRPVPVAHGTSPRVRGKLCEGSQFGIQDRYIPARAGEAAGRVRTPSRQRVHPRACGGSGHLIASVDATAGTSPRVRGKRVRGFHERLQGGYIPARAGEAPSLASRA